jgi:hypothetical protein
LFDYLFDLYAKAIRGGGRPPLIDIPVCRLLAVIIIPAKEYALLSFDLVFPRWVMIT